MIPFFVKYNRTISVVNSQRQREVEILTFMKEKLKEKRVDNIEEEANLLRFGNSIFKLFGWSWSLMLPVDSGAIKISNESTFIRLEYVISFRRMLVLVGVVSILISSMSESILTGLISFIWLGGMNWIIGVIRHRIFFRNIVSEVECWD